MSRMMRLMNKVLPTCEDATHLTSDALDRPLTWREWFGLQLHLLFCVWCRRNARQMRLMREMIRRRSSSAQAEPTSSLSADARRRIAERLKQTDTQTGATGPDV